MAVTVMVMALALDVNRNAFFGLKAGLKFAEDRVSFRGGGLGRGEAGGEGEEGEFSVHADSLYWVNGVARG